ncbi:threonine synthase [Cardiosporidium cionae]|uniref:Threonine synthase n=1 Tax=Cardiosporidium cionae TaxID=476202 RepID=A0ABQ7JGE7_9APIC|nr:threonine synthase [Cardiosporidium cionae]|eukprot:KAF8823097.1 threonine synthase [Cardiosporidium cionae]
MARCNKWNKFPGCPLGMLSFQELCFEVMSRFIDTSEIPSEDLRKTCIGRLISRYLCATTNHRAIAKFKVTPKLTILGATSGDTGSAAIAGIQGRKNIDCVILYPKDRTSRIQELQMTTTLDENITCIAINGSFDDCQSIVKSCLNSELKELCNLVAANSINWARILAQMTYFWYAAFRVLEKKNTSLVDFSVPTGNFGNILSAFYARKMGAPIGNLIIASNSNNILTQFCGNGAYKVSKVIPTISPAMDIQVSSNLERFLFDRLNYDGALIKTKYDCLANMKEFYIDPEDLVNVQREFFSFYATENETKAAIKHIFLTTNVITDPHTAVGFVCAEKFNAQVAPVKKNVCVCVATAHFGKFIDSIREILGDAPLEGRMPLEQRDWRSVWIPSLLGKAIDFTEEIYGDAR